MRSPNVTKPLSQGSQSTVTVAAVCFILALAFISNSEPASAGCQEYYQSSGAVPGRDDCMERCVAGRKTPATYSCGDRCAEYCGQSGNEPEADKPCDLDAYIDVHSLRQWEGPGSPARLCPQARP